LHATLAKAIPEAQTVSIIHNDHKFDNCQFQPDNPDLVTSIFDWDMATLGDPLFDFASTMAYWPDPRLKDYDLPVLLQGNFPDKQFLRERYAHHSGFSLDNLAWFEAFALVKSAVIGQQLYARFKSGATKDPRMAKFGQVVPAFAYLANVILEE